MTSTMKAIAGASLAVAWLASAQPASSESLFKIVTVKDEIVVGLNDAELGESAARMPARSPRRSHRRAR